MPSKNLLEPIGGPERAREETSEQVAADETQRRTSAAQARRISPAQVQTMSPAKKLKRDRQQRANRQAANDAANKAEVRQVLSGRTVHPNLDWELHVRWLAEITECSLTVDRL